MGLDVRLTLGEHPHIAVTGQTIEPLRGDQLGDLLCGRDDLVARVKRHQGHGSPDGVHLSDDDGLPHRLRGTFAKYGWQPATLTHRAQDAGIVAVTAQPVILADQLAENASSTESTQKAEIARTVTNTVSREAHWDVSSTVEQTVSYEIGGDAAGGKVGGSTSLSFTAGYGESTGTSESVEVSSAAGVEAVLAPGAAVVFELGITSGRIEARVTYAVQLTGGVFVHYGQKKGGHYFWYVPLARLYDRSTLERRQRESLKVDFYAHARTTQRDPRPDELG